MAEYFAKATVMIAALAASGAIGLKMLSALDSGLAFPILVSWLVLSGFGAVLIGFGGLAFRRFNISEAIS